MSKRFAFFYFMKPQPDNIGPIVPLHISYWHGKALDGYQGGPFSDRSGGLITFEAENIEAATALAMDDPFVKEDLLETTWVKEWMA